MAKTASKTKGKGKGKPKQSGMDMLNQIAGTATPTASKSKTPIVVVSDESEVRTLVEICQAKAKEKAAKQKSEMAQDKLRSAALAKWESQCQSDKVLHSSVKLTADVEGTTHSLTLTQKSQCKQMKEAEVGDEVRSIFGDEYDDHFGAERAITVNTDKLSDEQITAVILGIQKALDYADDPETYKAAIGVTAEIKPTEAFYRDRVFDPDFRKLACQAIADDLAVPHKASFKL